MKPKIGDIHVNVADNSIRYKITSDVPTRVGTYGSVYPALYFEGEKAEVVSSFLYPDADFYHLVKTAMKDKTNKPALAEIPLSAMTEMMAAFEDGKAKYDRFDYLKGHSLSDLLSAIIRHAMRAMWEGPTASDSGVSHIGHILANAAIIAEQKARGTLIDDTPGAVNDKHTET